MCRLTRAFSACLHKVWMYSKACVQRPLSKRPQFGFKNQISLNAGQNYCRMLQGEHSATLLTFIKQPFVLKIFALSIWVAVLHRFYCRWKSWAKSGPLALLNMSAWVFIGTLCTFGIRTKILWAGPKYEKW